VAVLRTHSGAELWLGRLGASACGASEDLSVAGFVNEATAAGFRHIVLLGTGESSLAPELLARTFGRPARPDLRLVDVARPAQLRAVETSVDLERALFVVSSSPASPRESIKLFRHFFARLSERIGTEAAARHFVAVVEPSSSFCALARAAGFSDAVESAAPSNELGAALAACVLAGRAEVSVVCSPRLGELGAGLVRRLAACGMRPAIADGSEPVVVYARLATAPSEAQDGAIAALLAAGHPVVVLDVADERGVGAALLRWEAAVAVAASIVGERLTAAA
jgi:transaldolase/glucose-6-phosphate isomerase